MKGIFRTAAALLLAASCAAPVLAQALVGTISGTIKDEQGAVLPGVTVTLTGKLGNRTAVTDASGQYRFPALEPGAYEVSGDLSGFAKAARTGIQISPGNELNIDLTMKVSSLQESITVTGEAPVVDVKSSATQNTISQSLLYSAPITRTAINVINYAPGVNNSSAYGAGAGAGNALLIDGVDTRDPEGGTAWTFYNYNMVEEYQFQGLGAPAEYGGYTGAVVNTITKSGGNRFSGLFDFFGSNDSLGSNNVPTSVATENPTLSDPAKTTKYADITTQIGGPIQQNKLFFFASAQRFLLVTDPSGPVTERHEVSPRLNGKLTWQMNPSNQISAHVQRDAYNIKGRAGSITTTDEQTVKEDAPEYVWLTQYRHIFNSNTFAEVKYTGWWGFYDLNPTVDAAYHFDGESGLSFGSSGYYYYADRTRDQVNGNVTHYADKFGHHELKFGAEIEHSTVRNRYGYPTGFAFYDYAGVPYYAYSYSYDISATNKRQSVFAQDAWHATNRLTLNLGVRGDMIQGAGKTGGNVYSSSNWAARIGGAFDLAGDNSTVLKATYGRYYEGAQAELFERALPGVTDYLTYAVNPDGTVGDLIDTSPFVPYKVASNIKHPSVQEETIGFERALTGTMRLSLTGIFRDNKDFVNSVPTDQTFTPVQADTDVGTQTLYKAAGDASNFTIQNVDGFQYYDVNGNLIGTAKPFRRYRAFMAVLNKRYTNRWQAQVSYVFAKTTGNVDNNGSAQLWGHEFETPNLAFVNSSGPASNTPTHEFKLLGSYQIPVIETSVSGYFVSTSGLPYGRLQRFGSSIVGPGVTSSRTLYIQPRGSYYLPSLSQLDLRIEKNFNFGSNRYGVYADLSNLFNSGTVTDVVTRPTSVTLRNGVTYPLPFGTAAELQSPRQIRIGARWSF
jgi:hypothetical protein